MSGGTEIYGARVSSSDASGRLHGGYSGKLQGLGDRSSVDWSAVGRIVGRGRLGMPERNDFVGMNEWLCVCVGGRGVPVCVSVCTCTRTGI